MERVEEDSMSDIGRANGDSDVEPDAGVPEGESDEE